MTAHPFSACTSASPFATAAQQLLPAIPYLVGYRPSDSLVAVFLREDGSLAVTARMDWEVCRADPAGAAAAICEQAALSDPARVLVAAVDPVQPDDEALAAVATICPAHDIAVVWAGRYEGDTWRGLDCDLKGCEAHILDTAAPPPTVTELIAQGHAPRPGRDAIEAEVAAGTVPGRAPRALRRPRSVDIEAWRDQILAASQDVLADSAELSDSDVSVLAAACRDIRVRDVLLWRLTIGAEHVLIGWPRAWEVVSEVLRRCARPDAAAVGAVAAVVAWQLGDGIRAHACLDRADEADPRHSLAGLVRRSLLAGCPPAVWCEVMGGLTEESCRHGRQRHERA